MATWGQGAGTKEVTRAPKPRQTHLLVHLDVEAVGHLVVLWGREGSISPALETRGAHKQQILCSAGTPGQPGHKQAWLGQAMATARSPAPLPGAEVSVAHGCSPQDGHSPPRAPAGMGTTHTGAALPPQAAAASPAPTPRLFFGGKPDSNGHRNQTSGPGHTTQQQGEGKASLHVP